MEAPIIKYQINNKNVLEFYMINYLKDVSKSTPIGMLPDIINFNNDSLESEFNNIYDSSLNRLTKSVYAPTGSVKTHFGEFVNLSTEYITIKNIDSLKNSIQNCVDEIIRDTADDHYELKGRFTNNDIESEATEYSSQHQQLISHDAETIYVQRLSSYGYTGETLNETIENIDKTIQDVSKRIITTKNDISSKIDNTNSSVADLSNYVTKTYAYVEDISNKLAADIEALNNHVTEATSEVNDISARVYNNENHLITLDSSLNDISNYALDISNRLNYVFKIDDAKNYFKSGQNVSLEFNDTNLTINAVGYKYDESNNFIIDNGKSATDEQSKVSGENTKGAFAFGFNNTVSGSYAHAEGYNTTASGEFSHSEGKDTAASNSGAHAEGYNTTATHKYAHAEGNTTKARSWYSHAEGFNTDTSAQSSHAEGNGTITNGKYSHTEGEATKTYGESSHAEGNATIANGKYSHSEGQKTIANDLGAHAEGYNTKANGVYSHAEGNGTIASRFAQHVMGAFNIEDSEKYYVIVGNGASDNNRSNAATISLDGVLWANEIKCGSTGEQYALHTLSKKADASLLYQYDYDSSTKTEIIKNINIGKALGDNIVISNYKQFNDSVTRYLTTTNASISINNNSITLFTQIASSTTSIQKNSSITINPLEITIASNGKTLTLNSSSIEKINSLLENYDKIMNLIK